MYQTIHLRDREAELGVERCPDVVVARKVVDPRYLFIRHTHRLRETVQRPVRI